MGKFLLFILTLLSSVVYSQTHVTTSDLNVRDKPSSKSNVLNVLKQGDTISIDSLGEKWSKIVLENGENAYISSQFIQKTTNSSQPISESADLTKLYIV